MSPQAEAVTERLQETGQVWRLCSTAAGSLLAGGVSAGMLIVFITADALFRLPQGVLIGLFAAWAVLTAALIVLLIVRERQGRRSVAATARRLEMEFPALGSRLINLVQLSEAEANGQADFYEAAVSQAAEGLDEFPFGKAAAQETRRRRFVLAMQTPRDVAEAGAVLFLVLAAGYALHALLPRWGSAAERLLRPWAFVPSVGTVKIVQVTPGDTEVLIGAALPVAVEIANPEHRPYPATLYVHRGNEPETAVTLSPDEANVKFTATVPEVPAPLRYRVEVGDSQSPRYRVGVREKPTVTEVTVTFHYPPYLGRADESVTQKTADLDAPQFTVAELTIRASTPITGGFLRVGSRQTTGTLGDGGQTFRAALLLDEAGTYTIHLFNDAGLTDPEPRVNRIRVAIDTPPTVQLVEPARDGSVTAGKPARVVVRAGDDHGLGLVRVEIKRDEEGAGGKAVEMVASWTEFASATAAVLEHPLALDPKRFKAGETVLLRAVARDRRALDIDSFGPRLKLEAQESATPWQQVRVVSAEAKTAAELAPLDALRAALAKVLQGQVRARVLAAGVSRQKDAGEARRVAGEVCKQQVALQKAMAEVVASIGQPEDAGRLAIKRAANKLALGDMVQAVRQAEALEQPPAGADPAKATATLTGTQDRIIDVLRRLLNEAGRETDDLLAQMGKRPDSQLPADARDKLKELKDKLQEFLKQQKKVIEATENLAKMPVEDFTEKEKQLLKDLAAAEDDWSRFMTEKHSDLSKLPEQDFSNPSLLQEMVEVQTELKMAADALTKKSADIAVPLEQLGAEMAKEMTTNIEKWLPDTPDRERWSQEEPLTGAMKEAPMAELPKELEDIVGKLMEEEEDLFDEMEDASSSWADSLDKGAGWDALDGPISNNSARGVTGNRLPNTSEIGGRSGEGRQGKSSGEFVGDSAVGKGGRKTPSRLTPDAQVKGQVKDRSKDPVGGATGGGKESGQGGEGLQGPVPNRPERAMQRLAGRQADLRNKAEGVDLRFQVLNYHHADLRKLIAQMAAVETDLRAGRYQNALRRRDVLLEGLGQVKTYVKGEFTIRQDETPNLPTDIQKEILGSMQEPSPAGWEGLNRQYFERLATAKGSVSSPAAPPASPAAPSPRK